MSNLYQISYKDEQGHVYEENKTLVDILTYLVGAEDGNISELEIAQQDGEI